jgi:hypothetical protein
MKTSKAVSEEDSGLADFLIERAARNAVLGTVFHWYLMVECEDKVIGKMYARVAFQFMQKLVEVSTLRIEYGILLTDPLYSSKMDPTEEIHLNVKGK